MRFISNDLSCLQASQDGASSGGDRFGISKAATYTELSGPEQLQKQPLVSVIIPVYNRANLLGGVLGSIADQTYTDWEVIVVDDGSSDGSAEVALRVGQPGKIRVIRHEHNQGVSSARNSGILAARGRYVSFLDSDDSWHPEKLRSQIEVVEADPDPSLVFCVTQTNALRGEGRIRALPERAPLPEEPWSEFLYVNGGFAQASSFFLSRELALKVGFRPTLAQYEDHCFFLESGAHGARYRLVCDPLSIWNNDSRADRLSRAANAECGYRYLAEATGLITKKASLAFEVRYLGPSLFKNDPLRAIKLFNRASKDGAVLNRHLMAVWARCLLPATVVATLRRVFYR